MEKKINTLLFTYRIEYSQCDDGLYKLTICDNHNHFHHPTLLMDCDVDGYTAVNLTWNDVEAFFDAVKSSCDCEHIIYKRISTERDESLRR